ncbi:MAG: aspartate kinase [Candidatus Lokiarchaeota archaeon]|nr:aspartate kinase [Candidatus Lokiarchaeota archaeon]
MEKIIIMKFGGSCLKSPESFNKITKIIRKYREKNKIIIVLSALNSITDLLIECANKANSHEKYDEPLNLIRKIHSEMIDLILKDYNVIVTEFLDDKIKNNLINYLNDIWEYGISPYKLDAVMAHGEIFSTYIVSNYLNENDLKSSYTPANQFIVTDDTFTDAIPILDITTKKIKEKIIPIIKNNEIAVVTGFIARNKEGHITTLGRGGSDFSTTILAYSLKKLGYEVEVILWKDVDGVLSTNPKLEPRAKLIHSLSYSEAKELAYFGAKLIHPRCIYTVEEGEIPIQIRNFDQFEKNEFSEIKRAAIKRDEIVKGIAIIENVVMITVEGEAFSVSEMMPKILSLIGENKINILMISQATSQSNCTFLVSGIDGDRVKDILINSPLFGKTWFKIKRELDCSLIAIIGEGMAFKPGVAGKIFTILGENKVNIRAIAQGSSELNISCVISRKDLKKAIECLTDEFNLINK